jgi:hypothetical protein
MKYYRWITVSVYAAMTWGVTSNLAHSFNYTSADVVARSLSTTLGYDETSAATCLAAICVALLKERPLAYQDCLYFSEEDNWKNLLSSDPTKRTEEQRDADAKLAHSQYNTGVEFMARLSNDELQFNRLIIDVCKPSFEMLNR